MNMKMNDFRIKAWNEMRNWNIYGDFQVEILFEIDYLLKCSVKPIEDNLFIDYFIEVF